MKYSCSPHNHIAILLRREGGREEVESVSEKKKRGDGNPEGDQKKGANRLVT